jgi:hypothetical protein
MAQIAQMPLAFSPQAITIAIFVPDRILRPTQ